MIDRELSSNHGFWPGGNQSIMGAQMLEVHEDTLHFLGGYFKNEDGVETRFPFVKKYSISGSTTERLSSASGCHTNFGVFLKKDDKAIVVGGIQDPECYNQVWEYRFE